MGLPALVQVLPPLTTEQITRVHPNLSSLLSSNRTEHTTIILDSSVILPYVELDGEDMGILHVNIMGFIVVLDNLKKLMHMYTQGVATREAATIFVDNLSRDLGDGDNV
jgi:hypothetical protein